MWVQKHFDPDANPKALEGDGTKGLDDPLEAANQPSRGSLKDVWTRFGDNTSMHGLGKAVGSSFWLKRLVWALLVLMAAGMAISNLKVVFESFLEYPVSTELSVEYKPEIDFPAVAICNLNRIKETKFPSELNYLLSESGSDYADLDWTNDILDLNLRKYRDHVRIEMGHTLEEMLIECTFDGVKCDESNFTHTYSWTLGNCYTFNHVFAVNDLSELSKTSIAGPNNGLAIELDINQADYLSITPGAGVKVLVHPPNTYGFPEEAGLQAAAGFSTSISMKRVEIERTPPPYGDCIDASEADKDPSMNMFASEYVTTYTDVVCKKSCYQTEVYKACHCCDAGYPCNDEALKSLVKSNKTGFWWIDFCNTTDHDGTQSLCLLNVQGDYLLGNLPCLKNCKPPCSEATFKTTVSASKWPSNKYKSHLLEKVKTVNQEKGQVYSRLNTTVNASESDKFMDDNFLRLEVFYEEIKYEKIKSSPAYDWYRLLSDIGGQLGLWMGFSLMTGVELMELVMDAIALLWRRACGERSRTANDPNAVTKLSGQG